MAVYAIGRLAVLVVLGDKGLNVGRLLFESRPVLERIGVGPDRLTGTPFPAGRAHARPPITSSQEEVA